MSKERVIKNGYFICTISQMEHAKARYLCSLVFDGESGVVCAWEFDRVGNVDYYQDKMIIFPGLMQAEAALKMIYKNGSQRAAIFYRKWDSEVNRYFTVQTLRLKIYRALRIANWF